MPTEIDPRLRLLQATCFPGDGVVLRRGAVVVTSGSSAVVERLTRWACAIADVASETFEGDVVALGRRSGEWALAIAVPRDLDPVAAHRKIDRALALFVRSGGGAAGPAPAGGGSGGSSSAAARVYTSTPKARAS